jgi:hypothetical protein
MILRTRQKNFLTPAMTETGQLSKNKRKARSKRQVCALQSTRSDALLMVVPSPNSYFLADTAVPHDAVQAPFLTHP